MGLQIFDTPTQKRIVRQTKTFLRSYGWHVSVDSSVKDRRLDFFARKQHFQLNFSCTDDGYRTHKTSERMVTEMFEVTNHIKRNRGQGVVWILESELQGYSSIQLTDMGLFVLLQSELPIFTRDYRYDDVPPADFSPHDIALLSTSFSDCVHVANAFDRAGNYNAAIEWLSRAIRTYGKFSSAYWKLFCLYEKTGDFDRAEETASLALRLRRDDKQFLRGMEALELRRGQPAKAAQWKAKLDQPSKNVVPPQTFDQLMKARSLSARNEASTLSPMPEASNEMGSWFQRLFTLTK